MTRYAVLPLLLLTTSLGRLAAIKSVISLDSGTKTVAAVIAVHPPKFPLLLTFMEQFKNCTDAHSVMDVRPVFSNAEDEKLFMSQWINDKKQTADSALWKPITMTTAFGQGQNARSWKKLYGVARLLDDQSTKYSFAIMMDAEIGIADCNAFASFGNQLSAKFTAKKWFGDNAGLAVHQQNAAWAVARDETEMGELRKANGGTFDVYTWWNDVPWVEMGSSADMFQDWGDMIAQPLQLHKVDGQESVETGSAARLSRFTHTQTLEKLLETKLANTVTANAKAFVAASDPMTPEAVANHLGHGPRPVANAGAAFEHLIYQEYMVWRKGFVIEDLTAQLTTHDAELSMGERYCALNPPDKILYQQRVQPLWWVKCTGGDPPPSAPFWFHLDRNPGSER